MAPAAKVAALLLGSTLLCAAGAEKAAIRVESVGARWVDVRYSPAGGFDEADGGAPATPHWQFKYRITGEFAGQDYWSTRAATGGAWTTRLDDLIPNTDYVIGAAPTEGSAGGKADYILTRTARLEENVPAYQREVEGTDGVDENVIVLF